MSSLISLCLRPLLPLALCAGLIAGCGEDPEAAKAAAAEQAAAQEAAAEAGAKAFDDAVAQQNWSLAKALADLLQRDHPGSAAAARVQTQYADVKARAEAGREAARLSALWAYVDQPVTGGVQRSAAIYAKDDVDVDGSGPSRVQLIFRDHPDWGRSSYLVITRGDFDCYGGCRLKLKVDGKPRTLAGSRPDTDEAIAMFIDDHKALWKLARETKVLEIEFPVKDGSMRKAVFETGGLDGKQMAGW